MESNGNSNTGSKDSIHVDQRQLASAKNALSAILETRTHIGDEYQHALEPYISEPTALIVARPAAHRLQRDAEDIAFQINSSGAALLAVAHQHDLVALVRCEKAQLLVESLVDRNKPTRYTVAISLPIHAAADLAAHYELVVFALAANDGCPIRNAKDYALDYLLSTLRESAPTETFLHPALDKLSQYDAANQTNLLKTLEVYLQQDRNAQRCANILYLHRNSLQYRIRRIQELADIDLDDPNERAYLRLSFALR